MPGGAPGWLAGGAANTVGSHAMSVCRPADARRAAVAQAAIIPASSTGRGRVMQRAAEAFVKVILAPAHASGPSASRTAAMARAVWLFTAPGLIPIAAAVSASDKSA
jgi:hypothetical protein